MARLQWHAPVGWGSRWNALQALASRRSCTPSRRSCCRAPAAHAAVTRRRLGSTATSKLCCHILAARTPFSQPGCVGTWRPARPSPRDPASPLSRPALRALPAGTPPLRSYPCRWHPARDRQSVETASVRHCQSVRRPTRAVSSPSQLAAVYQSPRPEGDEAQTPLRAQTAPLARVVQLRPGPAGPGAGFPTRRGPSALACARGSGAQECYPGAQDIFCTANSTLYEFYTVRGLQIRIRCTKYSLHEFCTV
jgi:hypothetical protein